MLHTARVLILLNIRKQSVRMLKGLVLPRGSHSGEITLAGSRRLRFTLAAAPVLFAHAVVMKAYTQQFHHSLISGFTLRTAGNVHDAAKFSIQHGWEQRLGQHVS
jgi:hypothetical protein